MSSSETMFKLKYCEKCNSKASGWESKPDSGSPCKYIVICQNHGVWTEETGGSARKSGRGEEAGGKGPRD